MCFICKDAGWIIKPSRCIMVRECLSEVVWTRDDKTHHSKQQTSDKGGVDVGITFDETEPKLQITANIFLCVEASVCYHVMLVAVNLISNHFELGSNSFELFQCNLQSFTLKYSIKITSNFQFTVPHKGCGSRARWIVSDTASYLV